MEYARRIRVVAGVTAASVAAGAAAGLAVTSVVLLTISGHAPPGFDLEIYKIGGQTGAILGLLFGPVVSFGVLRRVPLGRLFAGTTLGAALGGVLGFAIGAALPHHRGPGIVLVLPASILGCGLVTARLWWASRRIGDAGHEWSLIAEEPVSSQRAGFQP